MPQAEQLLSKEGVPLDVVRLPPTQDQYKEATALMNQLYEITGRNLLIPIEYHLSAVMDLLVPFDFSKFVIWGLGQPDEFFDETVPYGICMCCMCVLCVCCVCVCVCVGWGGGGGGARHNSQVTSTPLLSCSLPPSPPSFRTGQLVTKELQLSEDQKHQFKALRTAVKDIRDGFEGIVVNKFGSIR
jgi:hypothetical protein